MTSESGRGKWQAYAVQTLGVEDDVLKEFKSGKNAIQISEYLKSKSVNINPNAIRRYLKSHREKAGQALESKSVEKYELMVMDYKKELTDILDEVKLLKVEVLQDRDIKSYEKLVGRVFQGIELLAKLSGDIKGANSVDINIVINEINQRAFDENKTNRQFHQPTIIDVEAEIVEEDLESEKRINKQ